MLLIMKIVVKLNLLKVMSNVFMRMVLFFDLPSTTKKDIREYNHFVKFLKKKGFVRMQESVFTKLALNQSVVNASMIEIRKNIPPEGLISILTITENQFSSIEHILGEVETDVITSESKVIKL